MHTPSELQAMAKIAEAINRTPEEVAFVSEQLGAEIEPIMINGEIVGGLTIVGPEIHATVVDSARGKWFRKGTKKVLDRLVKEHGYALTRVDKNEVVGKRFVQRLGFRCIGECNGADVYTYRG